MDNFFIKQKKSGVFKFISEVNLKEMVNINDLISNSRTELIKFAKIVLVVISISEKREQFIDKVSDESDKHLDILLDIIQKYIDLNDGNTVDNIDANKRRFTTRSSVLFNFKDPSMLFASIDKLRKTINNLQVEKEALLRSLSKAEEERKTLYHQIDIFQSTIALYKVKEDDSNMEIQDYKERLNSFNKSDQLVINSEMLLVEKSQQLSQLEEASTLKIASLNKKIASLQKEILDMHMVNEQSSQLYQDNQALKEELKFMKATIYNEIRPLKEENASFKQKIYEFEKENNNHQSKIIILRNDLKVEKQKSEVQNRTIIVLQNKFKEIETRPMAVMMYPDLKPLPEEINEDKIKELLMQIQEKELQICDLNKEMSLLKQRNELSQFQLNQKLMTKAVTTFDILRCDFCIAEEWISKSSIPSKEKMSKEIMKSRDEIKKRDRDIEFLKKAYSELKTKSEEEYNVVSSSLYELALHLTKIKNEVYGVNNSSNSSCNNNNKEIVE